MSDVGRRLNDSADEPGDECAEALGPEDRSRIVTISRCGCGFRVVDPANQGCESEGKGEREVVKGQRDPAQEAQGGNGRSEMEVEALGDRLV